MNARVIKVVLCDPEGISESVRLFVESEIDDEYQFANLRHDERDELIEIRTAEVLERLDLYFEGGDCATLEIDLDNPNVLPKLKRWT